MRRSVPASALVGVMFVTVVMLAGGSGLASVMTPANGLAALSSAGGPSAVAAAALAAASASLAAGHGPAQGMPLSCAGASSLGQATCSRVLATSAPGNIGSQKWEAEVAPSARASAAMAYDAHDRYVLMFGGFNGTNYLNDTWIFQNGMWVQLAPGPSPSARANASMAYDAADRYVVLFGGYNGQVLGDTWMFLRGSWTELHPSTSPSARMDATMTYDTRDGYTVLFGGHSGSAALGDTWTFLNGQWTSLSPATSPPARWGSVSTFDTTDNYVLLFGGYNGAQLLGDSWEFAGGSWQALSPTASPSARYQAGIAFDAYDGFVVLFGGASRTSTGWTADGDTWSYHGSTWTQIVPSPGVHPLGGKLLPLSSPAPRQALSMAYYDAAKTAILFGGIVDGDPIGPSPSPNTQVYGATDTWNFTAQGWTQVLSTAQGSWAQLPGRVGASIAFDPTATYKVGSATDKGYAVAFGGSTAYGPNAETWIFLSYPSAVWSETFPVHSPSARSYAAMAYDPADSEVVLFGGMSPSGTALGDTWTFQNGNWTQLSPATSPAARYGAMMAYDTSASYLVLYGGTDGSTYYSDTWTFHGGSWSQDTGSPQSPPQRAFGGFAWDNTTDYLMLFGGTNGNAALNDVWTFVSGTWTQLHPTTVPPASWGMVMVNYEPRNQIWLFGGCTAPTFHPLAPSCPAGDVQGTAWEWKSAFSVVAATPRLTAIPAAPQARYLAAAAYDPHAPGQAILLFDGMTSSAFLVSDRWVFQSNIWNPWAPPITPIPRWGAASTWDDRSQNMLMFGGIGQLPNGQTAFLNDSWEWDTGAWGQANPPVTPSPRAFAALTYFGTMIELKGPTSYNNSVLFGGVGPSGYLGDTWQWVGSEVGGHWTQVHPTTSPSPRANASMVYDVADNEVVLFGGQNAHGFLGDTWVFSVSGKWTQLTPTASPSPRAAAAIVYDHEDGYVLLFGGENAQGALGDTWTFLHGKWTQLTPTTSPSPRYGAGIVDCPTLITTGSGEPQLVLLVGGTSGPSYLGDTWAFLGGQWTLLPATQPGPVPFAFGAMSNDFDDGHASVYGGISAYGILSDFWEFKHGS